MRRIIHCGYGGNVVRSGRKGLSRRKRPLSAFRAAALLFASAVTLLAFALSGCSGKALSVTGAEETALFVRLGVYDPGTEADYNSEIRRFDAVLALERLLGAGDEIRAADYFRLFPVGTTVDFFADAGGVTAKADDNVSAVQAYGMCLKALGLAAGTSGDAAGADSAVMSAAAGAGFGFSSGVINDKKLTVGAFSVILSEFMMLRPSGESVPVYRLLAASDPDFMRLLLNNGCYDDVPQDIAPRFGGGYYKTGSFMSASGNGKKEWTAGYVKVSQPEIDEYIAKLESSGWVREGKYTAEPSEGNDSGDVIYLYYKTDADAFEGETGLAMRYGNGELRWSVMS